MGDVTEKKGKSSLRHKIATIAGTILSIILIPILVINITLIIKSYVNKGEISGIGGFVPLIVLTDSMYPVIQSGDLVICHTANAEDVQKGDVIAFVDPAGNGKSVVTHRVIEIMSEEGQPAFRTQGDANDFADELAVPADKLIGIFKMRIAGAGNAAMFLQSSAGLIICVVIQLLLLISYDMIRRRIYERRRKEDTETLLRELEQLRMQNEEKGKECFEHDEK